MAQKYIFQHGHMIWFNRLFFIGMVLRERTRRSKDKEDRK